jgi:hypothetical protein
MGQGGATHAKGLKGTPNQVLPSLRAKTNADTERSALRRTTRPGQGSPTKVAVDSKAGVQELRARKMKGGIVKLRFPARSSTLPLRLYMKPGVSGGRSASRTRRPPRRNRARALDGGVPRPNAFTVMLLSNGLRSSSKSSHRVA